MSVSASEILSISDLNRRARQILETGFPLLWVSGEVSNLTRAASGHYYFSLKDENAQVRCVMFRSRAQTLPWRLENGQQVEANVLVSLYEARGDFQLNIEALRRAGLGRLFEAFARLKAKLEQEGLFAPEKKRALPAYPRAIGVISSPQAAALRDVLTALQRRAPQVPVIVYPTLVQGESAAEGIAAAIAAANARAECEVLIVARGGGSIEDLWAFNEEVAARAIAASGLPVVSGVGHETDFTIADFAADLRAPTPTAAAELVSAGWFAARRETALLAQDLHLAARRQLQARMQQVDLLAHRLVSPRQKLLRTRQQLALLRGRLDALLHERARAARQQLTRLQLALQRGRPQLQARHGTLQLARSRMAAAMRQRMHGQRQYTRSLTEALAHLNPESTLARGYSIVRDAHGAIVHSSSQLQAGDAVSLRFGAGGADAHIDATED